MSPKVSTKLARALRDDVRAITRGKPMRWLMVHELGLRHFDASAEAIDAAVSLAIASGWLEGDGSTSPHSVCLTDSGRGGKPLGTLLGTRGPNRANSGPSPTRKT